VIAESAVPAKRVVMRGAVNTSTQGKTAKLPTSATAVFFGVSDNILDSSTGEQVTIIRQGQALGVAAAAITRGQRLITDVAGKLSPAADAVGEQVIGVAEEDAAIDAWFAFTITNYVR
jgi:hypothetical protein